MSSTEIQSGLHIQVADLETQAPASSVAAISPSAGLSIVLQGEVDVILERNRHRFGAVETPRHTAPEAVFFCAPEPAEINRILRQGIRLRHISAWATLDWLERSGLAGIDAVSPVFRRGSRMTHSSWTPTRRIVSLAERLLQPSEPDLRLGRLYMESHALEIFAETLGMIGNDKHIPDRSGAHGLRKVRRVREMLEAECDKALTVGGVAREFGMSVDALQRQFRAVYGVSVYGYLHEHRMQLARQEIQEGASVSETAWKVGYNSPANFSTAFRRRFGVSPKQARSGMARSPRQNQPLAI